MKYWPGVGYMPDWWKPTGREVTTPEGGMTLAPGVRLGPEEELIYPGASPEAAKMKTPEELARAYGPEYLKKMATTYRGARGKETIWQRAYAIKQKMPAKWEPTGTEVMTPTGGVTMIPEKPIEPAKTGLAATITKTIEPSPAEKEILAARAKEMRMARRTMEPSYFKIKKEAEKVTPREKLGLIFAGSTLLSAGVGVVTPVLPVAAQFGVKAVGATTTGLFIGGKAKAFRETGQPRMLLPTAEEAAAIAGVTIGGIAGVRMAKPKVSVKVEKFAFTRKKDIQYTIAKGKIVEKFPIGKKEIQIKTIAQTKPTMRPSKLTEAYTFIKGKVRKGLVRTEAETLPGIVKKGKGVMITQERPDPRYTTTFARGKMLVPTGKVVKLPKTQVYTKLIEKTPSQELYATLGVVKTKRPGVLAGLTKIFKKPEVSKITHVKPKKTSASLLKDLSAQWKNIGETVATKPKPVPFVPKVTTKTKPSPTTSPTRMVMPEKPSPRVTRVVPKVETGFPGAEVKYPHKLTISKEWAGEVVESSRLLGRATAQKLKRRKKYIPRRGQIIETYPIQSIETYPIQRRLTPLITIPTQTQIRTPVQTTIRTPITTTIAPPRLMPPPTTTTTTDLIEPPTIPIIPITPGIPSFTWGPTKRKKIKLVPKKHKRRKYKYQISPGAWVTGKEWKKFPKKLTGLEVRYYKKGMRKVPMKFPKVVRI